MPRRLLCLDELTKPTAPSALSTCKLCLWPYSCLVHFSSHLDMTALRLSLGKPLELAKGYSIS